MTSLVHSPVNDTRFNDLMKEVREFGRESAEGKDALPKLALKVVRAAADGVISLDIDKKTKQDDAARIFETYANAESGKLIHERTKDGLKANVSKLRSMVKLGLMTTCDGAAVVERAAELRKEMIAQNDKIKVQSAYPAYISVARVQLENDTQLNDDQIKGAMMKPEGEEPTIEKELKRALKIVESLVTGEKGLTDPDERTHAAHRYLQERLAALIIVREQDEILEKAAKLGLHVVTSEPELPIPAESPAAAQAA